MTDEDEAATYSINEVSDTLGIEAHVLRYWETEFGALQPQRDASGRRRYTENHKEIAGRIQHLLKDEKYTIAGARQALERDADRQQVAEQLQALRGLLVTLREQVSSSREA